MADEEVLRDMVTGVQCSNTDTIGNATSDSKFDNSQHIADVAVDLKKLERKRKD